MGEYEKWHIDIQLRIMEALAVPASYFEEQESTTTTETRRMGERRRLTMMLAKRIVATNTDRPVEQ